MSAPLGLSATRAGKLAALVAGASLPLAFAPFHLFPLAILAPAVLFVLWLGVPPAAAAWRGWLFGLGQFGVGVSWIHESFRFSQMAAPVAVLLTGLFVVFLALYPALLGYLLARFTPPGDRIRLGLAYPAGWVLAEWVRGWLLGGFPWLNLGYSEVDAPLAGLAPLLGVYGLSWAVALSAGLVALVARERGRSRVAWGLGLVLLWGAAAAAGRVRWTHDLGKPVSVVLVQGNVPQDVKWLPDQRRRTVERYLSLTRAHWGADLIVWPETAVPAFYHQAESVLDELGREASAAGTEVLLGIPVDDPASGRYFNSVVALGPEDGMYHKRHLVPFGEYVPLKELLGPVLDILQAPVSNFSAGPAHQAPLRVAGQKVGVSICYEDVFGEEVIQDLPEATVLVNVSNDAWFGDSIAPHQHLEMARMRALETGRYLLRATNTGISAVIGPHGTILARSPQFEADALSARVVGREGATPYVRAGNVPVILGVLAALGVAGGVGWIRRKGG